MNDFRLYEDAIALHRGSLISKTTPVYCWDFHSNFLDKIKNIFLDLNTLNLIASKSKWIENDWNFKNSLNEEVIIITDAKLKIVFASHNITAMNCYSTAEVVGNTPRMFQGEATNEIISKEIRKAIIELEPFEKTIINYKKNGETYECLIKGFPIFNSKGELSHYIAFEKAA